MIEHYKKPDFLKLLGIPFMFIVLLWVIKYMEWKTGGDFGEYGLFPGKIIGLRGIVFAPLLHADFYHLFSNTVPLLILGAMMFYFYEEVVYQVFFIIYFFSEAATWFFARPTIHIGASGLVYGLVCFLFLSGLIRQNIRLLGLSLLVVFLYGSLVWGIIPLPNGLSWETHLSGALTGLICALIFRKKGMQKTVYEWEEENEGEWIEPVPAEIQAGSEPLQIQYIITKDDPEKKENL